MDSEITDTEKSKESQQKEKLKNFTDLDKFLCAFEQWNQSTLTLLKTNTELSDSRDVLIVKTKRLQERKKELETENSAMKCIVEGLYQKMHLFCDIEDENRTLKTNIEEKALEIAALTEEKKEMQKEFLKECEKLKSNFEEMSKIVQREKEDYFLKETNKMKCVIESKDEEINSLKETLSKQDFEHKANTRKITLEFEEKLSKLKQKIPHNSKQMNSSNQEIFRMKFLNLKTEYDCEVKRLQQTISSLENKLRERQENVVASRPSLKKRKH